MVEVISLVEIKDIIYLKIIYNTQSLIPILPKETDIINYKLFSLSHDRILIDANKESFIYDFRDNKLLPLKYNENNITNIIRYYDNIFYVLLNNVIGYNVIHINNDNTIESGEEVKYYLSYPHVDFNGNLIDNDNIRVNEDILITSDGKKLPLPEIYYHILGWVGNILIFKTKYNIYLEVSDENKIYSSVSWTLENLFPTLEAYSLSSGYGTNDLNVNLFYLNPPVIFYIKYNICCRCYLCWINCIKYI